ncbi:hypothetical protein ACWEWI_04240 [Streptomyces sp. NPDC003753]|uniref:hypothetical protein n=1 Tax=Streptomyces sp. Y2F8-2 TaxID=2759675 RepID=UPI0019057982|nr:hypothetical protein [Streptomyces sp. Y2F8-2]GHJ98867.1 hypothetical protein SY2F82_06650 [Streptomyces sp. Y2F8-2]
MVYLVLTAPAVGFVLAALTIVLVRRERGRAVAGPQAQRIEAAATRHAVGVRGRARAYTRFARRF